jgi:hypothetical protein
MNSSPDSSTGLPEQLGLIEQVPLVLRHGHFRPFCAKPSKPRRA